MFRISSLFVIGLSLVLGLVVSAQAAPPSEKDKNPTIQHQPQFDPIQKGPQIQKLPKGPEVDPRPKRPPIDRDALQHALYKKAHIVSGYISAYVVPFESWCLSNPNGNAEARVWFEYSAPSIPATETVAAKLVSDLGPTNHEHLFNLTRGTHNVGTTTMRIPAREICSDRCIEVHLEARNAGDATKVSNATETVCVRE